MPTLILAFNYWMHLLATVIWLGGLATLTLIAWPGMLRTLDDESARSLFDVLERRFRPLANISLVVLLVTGMIQMSGDSHYDGFLALNNAWSVSLLVKHIVIILMIVLGAILQFGLNPALDRTRLAATHIKEGREQYAALQQRLRRLTILNMMLGVIVLLLTAYMTAL